MDKQWVKILAESRLEDGQWKQTNPNVPREVGRSSILKTIAELNMELRDAIQVFNDHCKKEKKMSIFPIHGKDNETLSGFVVVVGRLQLQVLQHQAQINVQISRMQGFQQRSEILHTLEAHCDPFGGISWIMDQKSIMTKDMLVKQLLHDICHEAYLSEW
ncbi:MAG: hypothetical protein H7249_02155 [Chitinophagaceae bacterium]|nr:hypothetical protein [Oligoflexus sp.]